jgi:hypothetical protein
MVQADEDRNGDDSGLITRRVRLTRSVARLDEVQIRSTRFFSILLLY